MHPTNADASIEDRHHPTNDVDDPTVHSDGPGAGADASSSSDGDFPEMVAGDFGERIVSWLIVAVCCGFVFYSLHPDLILANTTPTGGDMGAHVWGPRFLADHLLGNFRLSGWTQDWYAGFPVYVFYMVVPSLMILWLSASLPLWVSPFLLAGIAALGYLAVLGRRIRAEGATDGTRKLLAVVLAAVLAPPVLVILWHFQGPTLWLSPFLLAALAHVGYRLRPHITAPWLQHLFVVALVLVATLIVPVPYNVAFKLVAISGLVTLPIAAYALARALGAPFPAAPMVAVGTLPFIYDKGFTILGGNGASTMAGEFAFSISLTFALFYLAVLFRGAETGRWRAPGAVLLALTLLCHIIPAIFVVVVTLVVAPFLRGRARLSTDDADLVDSHVRHVPTEFEVSIDLVDPVETDEPALAVGSASAPQDPDESEPWWSRSWLGTVVGAAVIGVLIGLVMVDRTWLNDTASHVITPTGVARRQHLFPTLASIAAIAFFTRFQPRVRNWVTTKVGFPIAIAITILVGAVIVWKDSGWLLALGLLLLVLVYFVGIDTGVVRWVFVVAPVAALLSAFWMLPFLAGSTFMNDMGWEKYTRYWDYLLAVPELDSGGMPFRNIFLVAAGLGLVLSVLAKVRLGWMLGLMVLVFAWMFRFFPQYRLWNARLLPFYFLAIYMLAGLAVGLVIKLVLELLLGRRPQGARRILAASFASFASVAVVAVVLGSLLVSFKQLPGGSIITDPKNTKMNVYRWAGINFPIGIVPDWAAWNFAGVERKPAYPEFKGVVDMMSNVGENHGCGRAFWEFDGDLNRFGTTMSLMMLPYYSEGCIGSMEGLYFEASSTTPFHFLMQSALSVSPSRAQREMPYPDFDIDLGVQQMQLMGVRYYMASSDRAIEAAEGDQRLDKVADQTFTYSDGGVDKTNRWAVFEVRNIRLVQGLEHDPVVLKNANDHIDGWVYDEKRSAPTAVQAEQGIPGSKTPGPAVNWFMDPSRWDVFLATSGPSDWPRASVESVERRRKTDPQKVNPPVQVSNIKMDQGSVEFDVDRTGVPVLVKVSYFPNWKASGATGPYRVTPNFMVVVPTGKHVTLTYGRSTADLSGLGLSSLGVAGTVGLAVLDDRRRRKAKLAVESGLLAAGDAPTDHESHL